jgi:photosystem II stability/assembly factor-like uncharacterized protein
MKLNKLKIIILIIVLIPLFSFSVDWYIYYHNMTKENLNFLGKEFDDGISIATGDNGVVLECEYAGPYFKWTNRSLDTKINLYGSAESGNIEYVVGSNGKIFVRNSAKYHEINSPTTKTLYSVTLLLNNKGFIVGENGTILYSNDFEYEVWNLYESSPTSYNLYSVSGRGWPDPENPSWAVGANGTILDYENGVWYLYNNSPTTNDLYSVSVDDANKAYACGSNGTILLYNGSSWLKVNSNTTENLYAINFKTDYDIFCVGANGTILYSSNGGYNWVKENCPVNINLKGICGGAAHVWAVGDFGTILSRGKSYNNIIPSSIGIIKAIFK